MRNRLEKSPKPQLMQNLLPLGLKGLEQLGFWQTSITPGFRKLIYPKLALIYGDEKVYYYVLDTRVVGSYSMSKNHQIQSSSKTLALECSF